MMKLASFGQRAGTARRLQQYVVRRWSGCWNAWARGGEGMLALGA